MPDVGCQLDGHLHGEGGLGTLPVCKEALNLPSHRSSLSDSGLTGRGRSLAWRTGQGEGSRLSTVFLLSTAAFLCLDLS